MSTWFREETEAPNPREQRALEQEIAKSPLPPPRIIVQNGKILDRQRFKAHGVTLKRSRPVTQTAESQVTAASSNGPRPQNTVPARNPQRPSQEPSGR